MKFTLMLALQQPPSNLKFPVYASPKLDGIRATIKDGLVISREIKAIPNQHIQSKFGRDELNGLDGELIIRDWTSGAAYTSTASIVMSKSAPINDIIFCVFDRWAIPGEFSRRLKHIELFHSLTIGLKDIKIVPHILINNQADLDSYEEQVLEAGFEGVMLRSPDGRYKYGRSTESEALLMKLKRFKDSEAIIKEILPIESEGTTLPIAGSLIVEDPEFFRPFGVSLSRLTKEEKERFWNARQQHIGRKIRYRYFAYGMKDVPRHGRFTSFYAG